MGWSQVSWVSETAFRSGTWGRKMGTPPPSGNRVIIEKAGDSGRQEDVGVALAQAQAWRSQESGECPRGPFLKGPGAELSVHREILQE